MLKKLSSKYQLYVCGNFLSKPWFWKKLLFPDSLLVPKIYLWMGT